MVTRALPAIVLSTAVPLLIVRLKVLALLSGSARLGCGAQHRKRHR